MFTWSGRSYGKIFEGALAPLQKLKPLIISGEFNFLILEERTFDATDVRLDGVIHHQINWNLRVYMNRVFAQTSHGIAHSCQVDHSWHPGEVLQNHSSWLKWDLHILLRSCFPIQNLLNIQRTDLKFIAISHCCFKKHTYWEWQFFLFKSITYSFVFKVWQRIITVFLISKLEFL